MVNLMERRMAGKTSWSRERRCCRSLASLLKEKFHISSVQLGFGCLCKHCPYQLEPITPTYGPLAHHTYDPLYLRPVHFDM